MPVDRTFGTASAGLQQTGQLERSNADKAGALAILDSCEAWQERAAAAARKRRIKL